MTITKVVIIRHGESQWNNENRFTGWTDVDLSNKGRNEAKQAGKILKEKKFIFDVAYTSVLKRAIHTLWIILDELDQTWLPIEKCWRLNERHYGALQGLNKKNISKKYGEIQVKQWRRGFAVTPPELSRDDKRFPGHDIRYSNLNINELPTTESLASTINRVLPYWNQTILPRIKNNERIIIVAHGNSIRAMMYFLNSLNEEEMIDLHIPTGVPLIYEFNKNIQPIKHYYLGNAEEISAKITTIAHQGTV